VTSRFLTLIVAILGLPPPRVWQAGRSVWKEEYISIWFRHTCGCHWGMRSVQKYVFPEPRLVITHSICIDVTSLSILRGIQGIGSAAQIPASVCVLFEFTCDNAN